MVCKKLIAYVLIYAAIIIIITFNSDKMNQASKQLNEVSNAELKSCSLSLKIRVKKHTNLPVDRYWLNFPKDIK